MDTLGTGIDVSAIESLDDKLKAGGLDWKVKLTPTRFGDFGEHVYEGVYTAMREDTEEPLDIYRTREVVQNIDTLTFFSNLLKEYGDYAGFEKKLTVDNVGTMIGNDAIYYTSKLPIKLQTKQSVDDVTEVNVIMVNSHKCGVGAQMLLYYERLVCTNGMTQKLKNSISVGHNLGFYRKALDCFNGLIDIINDKQKILDVLAVKKLTIHQAEDIIVDIFGNPVNEKTSLAEDSQPQIVTDVMTMFSDNSYLGSQYVEEHSAYALMNCVTEYYSHYSEMRNDKQRLANITGVQPSSKWLRNMANLEKQLVSVALSS